jgi:hypothetical protein
MAQSAASKPPENGKIIYSCPKNETYFYILMTGVAMPTGPTQGGSYGPGAQQPFYPAHQGLYSF